mmetsp:Transcript_79936/g.248032  ORF Transcript_79936/g.248032 Transcript_79936/m.248032 type:complete len:647 (-) Transcript_79936:345-2285(-)
MEIAAVAVALVCVLVVLVAALTPWVHVLNAVQALRLYVFDGRGDVFVNANEATWRFRKLALLGRETVRAWFKRAALGRRDEVSALVEEDHMREGGARVMAHNGFRSMDKRLVYEFGDDHGMATANLQTIRPDNAAHPGDWDKPKTLLPKENAMLATYAWKQSPHRGVHPQQAEPFLWQDGADWTLVEAWTVERTEGWNRAFTVRGLDELTAAERTTDLMQAEEAFARVLRTLYPDTFQRNNIKYAETETRNVNPVYIVPPILQHRFLTHPKVQRQLGIKSFRNQELVVRRVPTSFRSWRETFKTDSHVKKHRIVNDVEYVFYTRTGNKEMTNPQSLEDFRRERAEDDTWNISEMVRMPEEDLGEGAFGRVLPMKSLRTDEVFAVKFVEEPLNTPEARLIRNDIELLVNQLNREARPPNLVAVRGLYWSCNPLSRRPCRLAIAMDRYPTNLTDAITDDLDDERADRLCRRKWTREVHRALEYMHTQLNHGIPVLHRDLKPDNVLLDRPGGRDATAYVADFGHACIGRRAATEHLYGTPGFQAPEVVANQEHGVAADNCSLGSLAWWAGGNDIPGTTEDTRHIQRENIFAHLRQQVDQAVQDAALADEGEMFASDLADFANQLIRLDPGERMVHSEIRVHPYLTRFAG